MGAAVVGRAQATRLPLAVKGRRPLWAIAHTSPVASAQVKSAILLAGLYADGPVSVEEPAPSRDHSERMLRQFGARLDRKSTRLNSSHLVISYAVFCLKKKKFLESIKVPPIARACNTPCGYV